MSKTFTLDQLAEGIRGRDVSAENNRLVEKWGRTGLLRGLEGTGRENMARLLENQTSNLLREANSLSAGGGSLSSSGDIRGFSNIAFPIVRRVFGGLVANELVSIQPMSLPSGLLFYLDYTYGSNVGGNAGVDLDSAATKSVYTAGQSIYNNPVGKGIQSGSLATGGMYDLGGMGYSRIHGYTAVTMTASGAFGGSGAWASTKYAFATGTDGRLLGFDPSLTSLIEDGTAGAATAQFKFGIVALGAISSSADQSLAKTFGLFPTTTYANAAAWGESFQGGTGVLNLRRLNQIGSWDNTAKTFTPSVLSGTHLLVVLTGTMTTDAASAMSLSYPQSAALDVESSTGSTVTIPVFESNFGVSPSPVIPEIDIKIESIAVTATTRKLRARWSPELAQDLNAYHSIDAEVELTQILSETIALELDREILNDLLVSASGANYFWSRAPGRFVNRTSGTEVGRNSIGGNAAPGPNFTGTVREWYETLTETIIDVGNEIHRKTLRGSANFIVVGPDVATILEASTYYRPSYSIDGSGQVGAPFSIGAEKVGTLSNRFTVYKDPYFPRNKILVGFKGGSYLETGYVYAPYVPLIVTPTIFAPEDFTPRKGVMTRYGKKMVRSDFYGTVTVLDLNII